MQAFSPPKSEGGRPMPMPTAMPMATRGRPQMTTFPSVSSQQVPNKEGGSRKTSDASDITQISRASNPNEEISSRKYTQPTTDEIFRSSWTNSTKIALALYLVTMTWAIISAVWIQNVEKELTETEVTKITSFKTFSIIFAILSAILLVANFFAISPDIIEVINYILLFIVLVHCIVGIVTFSNIPNDEVKSNHSTMPIIFGVVIVIDIIVIFFAVKMNLFKGGAKKEQPQQKSTMEKVMAEAVIAEQESQRAKARSDAQRKRLDAIKQQVESEASLSSGIFAPQPAQQSTRFNPRGYNPAWQFGGGIEPQ
jgi:hypothetical protein